MGREGRGNTLRRVSSSQPPLTPTPTLIPTLTPTHTHTHTHTHLVLILRLAVIHKLSHRVHPKSHTPSFPSTGSVYTRDAIATHYQVPTVCLVGFELWWPVKSWASWHMHTTSDIYLAVCLSVCLTMQSPLPSFSGLLSFKGRGVMS